MATALPQLADVNQPAVPSQTVPDPTLRDALQRIAVAARDTTSTEAVDGVGGRTLFIDQPSLLDPALGGERTTASARLSLEMIRRIIAGLDGLEQNAAEFRAGLAGDIGRLGLPEDRVGFDPLEYARRVAGMDVNDPVRRAFDACAAIFADIDQSGLTPVESAFSKRKVVETIIQGTGLTPDQLVASIEGYRTLGAEIAQR